ncbi:hypothetical protein ACQEU6_08835 [Spirillospora sp. CA-108201]
MPDKPAPQNLSKNAPRRWPEALARPIEFTYMTWTGENTTEVAAFLGRRYDGVAEVGTQKFLSFAVQKGPGYATARVGTTFVRASDGRLEVFEDRGDFERLYDTDTAAKGADIAIFERLDDRTDPRVIVPHDIRINGRSVLAPEDAPVRVHGITIDGSELVQVTLTLFARLLRISHEKPA